MGDEEGEGGRRKRPVRRRKPKRGDGTDDGALDSPDIDEGFQSDWQKYGEKQADSRSNMDVLDNTIRVAVEADKMGAETLVKLENQREQLERMDENLASTNDSLNNSERIIRGMKSLGGALHNAFSSKKKGPDTRFKASDPTVGDAKGQGANGSKQKQQEEIIDFIPGQQTKIRKQGTLIKLGGFVKNWKERYFAVDAVNLCYFKEMPGPGVEPQGRIPLLGMKVSKFAEQEYGKKFCFGIRSSANDRIFVLVAKSDKDREEWVDSLRLAEVEVSNSLKPMSEEERQARAKFDADCAQEDQKLDQLSHVLAGLAGQSEVMGAELKAQNEMLTHIDGQVESTGQRIKQNTREIRKILKQ